MSAALQADQIITPEEFLAMEDTKGYELIDGRLEEKNMSLLASVTAGQIIEVLGKYVRPRSLGWVLSSDGAYRCFPKHPLWVRKPDASFISMIRCPRSEFERDGFVRKAPDLAVEVVSPNDSLYKLDKKVQAYLKAGVQVVWVVNPVERIVQVHRAKGPGVILGEADEIDAEPALPGFRCLIRELLPDLPRPEEA